MAIEGEGERKGRDGGEIGKGKWKLGGVCVITFKRPWQRAKVSVVWAYVIVYTQQQ